MNSWLRSAAYLSVMPVLRAGAIFHILSRADVFSCPLFRVVLAVAGAALIAPGAAAGACQGQIGAGTVLTGKTAYDPFSPAGVADSHQIAVTNTGNDPCAFALVFRPRAPDPRLGGALAYSLATSGGHPLLTGAPPALAPAVRTDGPVAPAASAPVRFLILIPRGQFAAPGRYGGDAAEVELYALNDAGRLGAGPLQTSVLHVDYTVERVLSVNIKGADASQTTMRFGALTKGAARTVNIEARSNLSFRLDVASDHRGALALTPEVPGQTWTVPYAAALGGQVLDLASKAALRNQPPTRPESDAIFPLTVTIGEVGQKRAGRYEDIITIDITGAAP